MKNEAFKEAIYAVVATPEYKAKVEADKAKEEAEKVVDKAWNAVKTTSKYKRYVKALNALLCRRHDEEEFNV